MLVFLQMDPTNSHGFLFGRFNLRGPPHPKRKKFQYKPWWLKKFPRNATLDVINLMISLLGDR